MRAFAGLVSLSRVTLGAVTASGAMADAASAAARRHRHFSCQRQQLQRHAASHFILLSIASNGDLSRDGVIDGIDLGMLLAQ